MRSNGFRLGDPELPRVYRSARIDDPGIDPRSEFIRRLDFRMSDFDQMGLIVDWFDACRQGDLGGLLDLYADDAQVECGCDGTRLYRGREEIGTYWGPPLHVFSSAGFGLEEIVPTASGIELEYSIAGSLRVRAQFGFSAEGKIRRTQCEPGPHDRSQGCNC